MMLNKKFGFQKQCLSITIIVLLLIVSISSSTNDSSIPKNKISSTITNKMIVLNKEDNKLSSDDLNNTYMQLKDSPNHKKARILAAKWAKVNAKDMKYKPYHVKSAEENIPNWKNYLVLMMGKKENYILKKVCFNPGNYNFGYVLDSNESCGIEVILKS